MISKAFAYHMPSDQAQGKINKVREAYTLLESLIKTICPASRETALALTALEESGMWSIKSIAINEPRTD